MRKYRPADQDVVVVQDESVQAHGDSLVQPAYREFLDFHSLDLSQGYESRRVVPGMVENLALTDSSARNALTQMPG